MTLKESRLVGYLNWVDDEDFTEPELTFLRRLTANPPVTLTAGEARSLRRLYADRSY